MYIDYEQLISRIPDSALVLDLGGWDDVFQRANVVVDLQPYETRSSKRNVPEQFSKKDWIIADFCSPSFWETVPSKAFDFITIGHTLEDVRDPLYICSQMIRCGKSGYIEVPSKVRELSKIDPDDKFSGFSHHRWIIEPIPDLSGLQFKAKMGWSHSGDFLGDERRHLLHDYHHFFDGYFWEGSFGYVELFDKGPDLETADAEWYFGTHIKPTQYRKNIVDLTPNSSRPDDGKCLWPSDYMLPSETPYSAIFDRYSQ